MRWEQAEVNRFGGLESQLLDGGMACVRHLIPAGFDSAALYRGLPGDMCPCEHWCYLVKAGCDIASRTVRSSSSRLGEAFHVRSGHLAEALEDAELIEFTAAEDHRRKAESRAGGSRTGE